MTREPESPRSPSRGDGFSPAGVSSPRRQSSAAPELTSPTAASTENSRAGGEASSSAAPGYDQQSPELRQLTNALLVFEDGKLEADFIRYIHPKSIAALPFFFTALVIVFMFAYANGTNNNNAFYSGIMCVIAAVVIWPIHLLQRFSDQQRGGLLAVERWTVLLGLGLGIAIDIYFNFEHKSNNCTTVSSTPVDERKFWEDPHCSRWWTPFPVGLVAFMSVPKFLRFTNIAGASVFTFACHMLLWLPFDIDSLLYNVFLQAIFMLAGLLFVCFVSYDHECTQRDHFLAWNRLRNERQRLSARQEALVKYCRTVVPNAALERVEREVSGGVPSSDNVDISADGTIVVVDVHDFARWCTTVLPQVVAIGVSDVVSEVRSAAQKSGIEFVGSFADMCVATGNLCSHNDEAALATLEAAFSVALATRSSSTIPPVRCVAHAGELRGVFSGHRGVRYDIFGPAFDSARSVIMDSPQNRVVASDLITLRAAVASPFEGEPIAVINEMSFGVLRHTAVSPSGHIVQPSALMGSATGSLGGVLASSDTRLAELITGRHLASTIASMMPGVGNGNRSQRNRRRSQSQSVRGRGGYRGAVALPDVDTFLMTESVAAQQHGSTSSSNLAAAKPATKTREEALRDRLALMADTRKVCCFFEEFTDPAVEDEFTQGRIAALPRAAARAFAAYALYVSVIFLLMIVDLPAPNDAAAIGLLLAAIGFSAFLGMLPRLITTASMIKWYPAWSVAGTIMPLMVVYGAALSRPAAVGMDPRVYMLIGTLLRTYLFTSTRWLLIVVPLTLAANFGQYLLPGAHLRASVFSFAIIVFTLAIAEIEREKSHRINARRMAEMNLIVEQLRSMATAREAMLRTAVPPRVLEILLQRKIRPQLISWSVPAGALLHIRARPRALGGSFNSQGAFESLHDMLASAGGNTSNTASNSGSNSSYVNSLGGSKSTQGGIGGGGPFATLERCVARCRYLSIGDLFGDSAIIVGPVVCTPQQAESAAGAEGEAAFKEALELGLLLTDNSAAVNAMLQSLSRDAPPTLTTPREVSASGGGNAGGDMKANLGASESGSVIGQPLVQLSPPPPVPNPFNIASFSPGTSTGDHNEPLQSLLAIRTPPANGLQVLNDAGMDSESGPTNNSTPSTSLGVAGSGPLALSHQHKAPSVNFSALMDYDSVVHATNIGEFGSYQILGVATTRLLAISAGTDPEQMGGLVVTERVVQACAESTSSGLEQSVVGPLKIRGAGIVRLIRLKRKQPRVPE